MMTVERLPAPQPSQQQLPMIKGLEAPGYLGSGAEFLYTLPQENIDLQSAFESFKHQKFSNLLIFDTYHNARTCSIQGSQIRATGNLLMVGLDKVRFHKFPAYCFLKVARCLITQLTTQLTIGNHCSLMISSLAMGPKMPFQVAAAVGPNLVSMCCDTV